MNDRRLIECQICKSDDVVYGAEVCKHCGANISYVHENAHIPRRWALGVGFFSLIGGVVLFAVLTRLSGVAVSSSVDELALALIPAVSVLLAIFAYIRAKDKLQGQIEVLFSKPGGGFVGMSIPLDF